MNIELLEIPNRNSEYENGTINLDEVVPFSIKRVYYVYDIPTASSRGGHAHIEQLEFLIAIKGSFDVVLNDGSNEQTIHLNNPNKGLLIREQIWREIENFSQGSVCLVVASAVFEEADYIRDFEKFKEQFK